MSNAVANASWKPVSFVNFSEQEGSSDEVTGNDCCVLDETLSETREPQIDIVMESQRAAILAEARDEGYQEGLRLGKEEGLVLGQKVGHQQGYKEGRQAIEHELADQIEQQKRLALETTTQWVANFQHAIQQLETSVVPHLTKLALSASEKLVGKLTPSARKQLTFIVQELIHQYPPLGENIQLYVNPEDVAQINIKLKEELDKYGWRLVSDPAIETGGCRVFSEKVEIDATLSSRWQNLVRVVQKDNE